MIDASPIRFAFVSLSVLAALAGACSATSSTPSEPGDHAGLEGGPGSALPGADAAPNAADAAPGDARSDVATQPQHYAPHLVNFDDLKSGTSITDQYKQWFVVSSIPGCALQTSANYDFGQSKPNYLTTYFSCNEGSAADVTFTFTRPVRKITLKGVGINGTKGVALMKLTHADGSTSEASLDGNGGALSAIPLIIPDTAPVAKLLITNIHDAYGIGLDDLGFEFPE